ncbi:uncharacterized protein LOC34622820 [Cyclospora cayetanensis]|uniref:Uncharacterized protein LOC34622820 n=1 Tax=Cyclospora cayetanensis TaxID=88456 RepID=A0A6P6RY66_9EIME|nr:uncharacterized protein LOC34622820 [Cyclospora cayetanensis]
MSLYLIWSARFTNATNGNSASSASNSRTSISSSSPDSSSATVGDAAPQYSARTPQSGERRLRGRGNKRTAATAAAPSSTASAGGSAATTSAPAAAASQAAALSAAALGAANNSDSEGFLGEELPSACGSPPTASLAPPVVSPVLMPPPVPRFPPSAPVEVGALRGPFTPNAELRREAHVQRLLLQLCQDDARRYEQQQQQRWRHHQQQPPREGVVGFGVPEVVQGRYHSLLLLDSPESLDRQRLLLQQEQQQQLLLPSASMTCGYPTVCFKALCLDDPHAYVLRLIALFPISSFDLVKAAVKRWAPVSSTHPNIVPLRQAFATADLAACLSTLSETSLSSRGPWGASSSLAGLAAGGGWEAPLNQRESHVGESTSESEEEGRGGTLLGGPPRGGSSRSSVVFVFDYYPNAYTLEERFVGTEEGRETPSEKVLWSVALQILMALQHIHNNQ